MPTYLSFYAYYYLVFEDDFQKALEISRQAWMENPEDVSVQKIYAYSLLFSGHREESEEILAELAANQPANLELIRFDSRVLKASGFTYRELEPLTQLLGE